jgi:hypothetical protein
MAVSIMRERERERERESKNLANLNGEGLNSARILFFRKK